MVMRDPKAGFQIPKAKFEESKRPLVSRAGLHGLLDIFDSTELGKEFAACMPLEGSNRAIGNYSLGLLLIASLLSGHDSLDDIEEFEDDDLIEEMFGKIPSAKTLGNFLRRFEPEQIER